jgi:exopolyphosphatase/guanosine-5'-triphosphate,3'-diphosphate pyrophosphatase
MGGRARIAAALIGACDKPALPPELLALADEPLLREAVGWGLAVRLCRRLGGGSRLSLAGSALRVRDGKLVLWFDPTQADLIADTVRADLAALAKWLGMPCEIVVGETMA